ncbi:ectonucleoside triphosphate diphosphohydrolase 2 [Myxocyprinus asiaticus]|uniref:ectonucleoside triphosphate diphosphohydrolase 2 n=1 Tax=Myxocyprinus asiaticus TaxID=70543 RepID=UPI0022227573|nr:ectonucleoside triphosphate diphosphohydrolase 2 [Myxocyprinus asiaticus]XP_051533041.1 ectonucleoside triphosphate diphosphohydrolase 2 [Myxocyprinus asiaticus]
MTLNESNAEQSGWSGWHLLLHHQNYNSQTPAPLMDKPCCKFVVSGTLLLFGIVSILLLTVSVDEIKEPPEYMYGIVLDAGSSHTAMHIYRWPADKLNGTGVVTQHSECHVKGGGISSYAGQNGAAGRSLEGCLKQAMQDIPKDRHHSTPVYLGATAGMRLLNFTNPEKSAKVLQNVGEKIKSFPFSFQGAVILSGQEEGAYGWITVNYLLENFIKYGYEGSWLNSGRKTVGALDLGGASTQITFETPETIEDTENHMTLRLYGQEYSLYTHSYLCYGKEEALRMILANLVKLQGNTSVVYHPCYPSDFAEFLKLEKIFDSACTEPLRPKPYNPHSWIRVQGTGDYASCLGNTSTIFIFNLCPFSQCSFNRVFQPNISGGFMAFSAYFFTYSFLQQSTGIKISTSTQLQEATQAVCNMTIDEMTNKAPDLKKYLKEYCAVAVYMQVLMLRGYHFDERSFQNVAFQKKAGKASLGWALGYILSVSSLLPEETVGIRKGLYPGAWIGLLVLLNLLFFATLCYIAFLVFHMNRSNDVS